MNVLSGRLRQVLLERPRLLRLALPWAAGCMVIALGCAWRWPHWWLLQQAELARQRLLLEAHAAKRLQLQALAPARVALADAQQRLQAARWRLAADGDMSDLLEQFAASGHAHGLRIEQVDVGAAQQQPGYWQTPIDVRVVGPYAGLRPWLDDWLGQMRLLRSETLQLTPVEGSPGALRLDMRVQAYRADEPLAAPAGLADWPARAQAQPVRVDPFSRSALGNAQVDLANLPLTQMQMVGFLRRGASQEALLAAAGRLHRVRAGDRLGQEDGVVQHVGEHQVQVLERVLLEGEPRERLVTLALARRVATEARQDDETAVDTDDSRPVAQPVVRRSAPSG